jgi:hypothetical protein
MYQFDFQNELFMGWDIEQWSVAIDRVGLGGTTMKYANRCRKEYQDRFGQDPLEFQLVGVQIASDNAREMASALFEQYQKALEKYEDEVVLDSSYGNQEKDDKEYDEAWQIRYGREYN